MMIRLPDLTYENGVVVFRRDWPDDIEGQVVETGRGAAEPRPLTDGEKVAYGSVARAEAKKSYADAQVPLLVGASEKLLAHIATLAALEPTTDTETALGAILFDLVQINAAVCAGLADLVSTLDKDAAFKRQI